MCGFAGAIGAGDRTEAWERELGCMAAVIRHRGPDDSGTWIDVDRGIGLAHRRLSILDLSPCGHQPMHSASGRYVLAYNGEVYNFAELRRELGEERGWRGHSDTEVILAAIEAWGVEAAVRRFVGMFAFALWDRDEARLYLVRDRLGIKPLYYGYSGGMFLFGSEIKALRAHSRFEAQVDRDAIALLLRLNYIPAPYSIYAGVHKLDAGCIRVLSMRELERGSRGREMRYWSMSEVAARGQREPWTGTEQEAVDELEAVMREAVGQRMVADVPVGAFLSGGLDSSLVVALMQAQTRTPVKTFTIGFSEAGYNEAVHARAVAQHLGTDHTELYVTPQDALDVIPKLPEMYDEPFSDSSQVPTFLVSELARRHVTVSLSGDGGDELFAGYRRYATGRDLWSKLRLAPGWARRGIGSVLLAAPEKVLDVAFFWMAPIIRRYGRPAGAGDKLKKLAEVLNYADAETLYHDLVSHWKHPAELVRGANDVPTLLTDRSDWPELADLTHRMMFLDSVTYLPDDIMVKVDRASMAVSLEARVPLLDHRVVELAWRLPLSMKVRDGQGKWAMRQVLNRHVPERLLDRPKMGFGVPIDAWLRGPLRDWCESLISEERLAREGYFDPAPIRRKWQEHLEGRRIWHYYLWDVLMFQAWLDAERNASHGSHCRSAAAGPG